MRVLDIYLKFGHDEQYLTCTFATDRAYYSDSTRMSAKAYTCITEGFQKIPKYGSALLSKNTVKQ